VKGDERLAFGVEADGVKADRRMGEWAIRRVVPTAFEDEYEDDGLTWFGVV
jgi:hypothetical protein